MVGILGDAVYVIAIILLACHWMVGDQRAVTKLILTAIYVSSWFLVYVGFWAVSAVQAIFASSLGPWNRLDDEAITSQSIC
jgi:hypothetical protein